MMFQISSMKFLIILSVFATFGCSSHQLSDKATEIKKAANKSWIGTWQNFKSYEMVYK